MNIFGFSPLKYLKTHVVTALTSAPRATLAGSSEGRCSEFVAEFNEKAFRV